MQSDLKGLNPNAVRSCEYLAEEGDKIAKTSITILWTREKNQYYEKIKDYCSLHKEMKDYLYSNYQNNTMINERIIKLSEIEFVDYSDDDGSLKFFFKVAFGYIFFPVMYVYRIREVRYFNRTKDKIYESNRYYSSIAFLLKAETQ